jgi:predicted site-specific integrase-resolvase
MTETISRAAVRQPTVEISLSEAAQIAGRSPDTVKHWIEEGAIEARQTSPHGWWKVSRKSLEAFLERRAGKRALENSANSERVSRAARSF